MYEIAWTVQACLRADTAVSVAWIVDAEGVDPGDRSAALALTPGGGKVGSLLYGALDSQLEELNHALAAPRLVDVAISEVDAAIAGLPSTGRARCVLAPARDLPSDLWERLVDREAVCLVTAVDGTDLGATTLYTSESIDEAPDEARRLFASGASGALVEPTRLTTVLVPVPKLVIVGRGPVASALTAAAELLGWHIRTTTDKAEAAGEIGRLTATDKLVVMGHDLDLVGPALLAALAADVGYIGALGGRGLQRERAAWLADRGAVDLERIHGPAGLDIGATTPAEIAVSILAEALDTTSERAAGRPAELPKPDPRQSGQIIAPG